MDVERNDSWCVIVADDHGPEYVPSVARSAGNAPVQYCGFGDQTTLLQKALHRAEEVAPITQTIVTVREADREYWEPALGFVHPERRFVSDTRATASLTTAAALLSIAAESPSDVVTIMPARCYVDHEWILCAALQQLRRALPRIPEHVGTLGMIDIDEGIDEDYLVPCRSIPSPGVSVQAMAHQPARWVAQHLRLHGAMVASGILTGYAGVFAGHIARCYPELMKALSEESRGMERGERRFFLEDHRHVPKSVLRPLKWWPPLFPQRAIRVHRSGWRGLHTAQAAARILASYPDTMDGTRWPPIPSEFQGIPLAEELAGFDLGVTIAPGARDPGWRDGRH